MNNKFSLLVVLVFLIFACRRTDHLEAESNAVPLAGSTAGLSVADTIIYQVIISNLNPDDPWAVHCLDGLNHRLLIDQIFEMVYAGKAAAYNHETNEKLTSAQVKKIEAAEGFRRDNIGMIQFSEAWYLDPEKATMTKNIHSMVLGYNYFSPEGERFHKALFRVELKK